MTVRYALDDIDKSLIRELQVDGRAAYSRLAPLVDMSEAAVRQRVNRLQDRGVIQIVAVTDPTTLGYAIMAMLGVKISTNVTSVAEKLGQLESVDYTVITTGRFDVLAEVVCTDSAHLLAVSDEVRAVDGVSDIEVMTYLRMVQQNYDWGTM
ncbi:MAG: Lrp/AsnC family transcriptional regulator [Acidimicrobiaceae bacterium]|jgi:Lrp/AsnC family transcriptional regulator, regulator for asnA, asnC and gidA|nr:Lrp/AsnC family transcriptional regulator [Acidimicrobiaceae bacterium]MBT5579855.1 Lrp/AsnC family transcriptional regulator [Acidimicrobiaceae bacterium]MBT5849382.1 Lrp/AsnC family transcriptional regulator [Acidimicrobiaceae bacterium]MDG1410321.1 Lrp/AsnC family transcriptional regulator [Acidimicrobiales bacterium]MDG2216680.1 Lrp/AsnC family transcriptional regulator [Acidimicrobiales bacterium]